MWLAHQLPPAALVGWRCCAGVPVVGVSLPCTALSRGRWCYQLPRAPLWPCAPVSVPCVSIPYITPRRPCWRPCTACLAPFPVLAPCRCLAGVPRLPCCRVTIYAAAAQQYAPRGGVALASRWRGLVALLGVLVSVSLPVSVLVSVCYKVVRALGLLLAVSAGVSVISRPRCNSQALRPCGGVWRLTRCASYWRPPLRPYAWRGIAPPPSYLVRYFKKLCAAGLPPLWPCGVSRPAGSLNTAAALAGWCGVLTCANRR